MTFACCVHKKGKALFSFAENDSAFMQVFAKTEENGLLRVMVECFQSVRP